MMLRPKYALVAILAGVLLLEAFIALVVFHAFPYSMDEYNYLFQSELFASGRRWVDVPRWAERYRSGYMVVHNGHLFSKYPPGFSLVLAFGTLLGIPALVNPALATATIYILYRALKPRFGHVLALICGLLVGSNSYFLGYGASLYSHSLCLFLAAFMLLLVMRYEEEAQPRLLVWMGLVAGLCFIVRPLDGFCLAVAAGVSVLCRDIRQAVLRAVKMAVPFCSCVLALYTYHWFLANCFCIATYRIWNMEFHVSFPQVKGFFPFIGTLLGVYWAHVVDYMVPLFASKFLPYAGPGFVLLSVIGMARKQSRTGVYCLAHIVLVIGLYNFHPTQGFSVYGARYWYGCIAAFAYFVVLGLVRLRQILPQQLQSALVAALVAYQLFQTAGDMETYGRRFTITLALYDQVSQQCAQPSAIYMVNPHDKEKDWPYYVYPWDMRRNGDLQGPNYVVWRRRDQFQVLAHKPDIAFCNWSYQKGSIAPVKRVMPRLNWDVGPL